MDISPEEGRGTSLNPRVAIASIVGFWLFYFSIITVRSLMIFDDQIDLLWRRTLVVAVCMVVTVFLYLPIRRVTAATLPRAAITVALLAVPAAVIHAATNFYAFAAIDAKHMAEKERKQQVIVVRQNRTESPSPPAPQPPAIPGVPASAVPPIPPVAPAPDVVTVQIGGPMYEGEEEKSGWKAIAEQAANNYFFFIAWAALYLALCYAAEAARAERRAAAFRAAAQAAELRALRYQVNPHFLFNTLNSLSSLVLARRMDEAERMIINLSTFFRTSLTADPTEDVPLAEEIRLQRLYLDIEAVRFPERLVADIQVPEGLANACVPALILQPLVENAVKYAVSRARRPVTLRIRAREEGGQLILSVTDDGDQAWTPYAGVGSITVDPMTGRDAASQTSGSTGVGLRNVADRLAARFGAEGRCHWGPLETGGFAVVLRMPLIHRAC